ncbi:hypothetical protein [Ekhidna sp.]|uniref:hypothetical protein n=1 Tax=Ekhidna sp. TaxID=2608089 RepID=UPI003B5C6318
MNGTLKSIATGALFCVSQRIGESVLGFIITDIRKASDVNFEGAIQFAFMGLFLSIVPYLIIFPLVKTLTKSGLNNSYISAGINLFVLTYFYTSGLIQKDPISFIVGSLIISILLIVVERRIKPAERTANGKTGT